MEPITVGMATFDDFDGVYFTIQSLRSQFIHDRKTLDAIRFVVVDSSPGSKMGARTKRWVGKIPGARYVAYDGVPGTSRPRDWVFEHATTDVVICVDSHVILTPGSVEAVNAYFAHGRNHNHLVSGVLVFDGFGTIATHFNSNWGAGMFGQWDKAYTEDGRNPRFLDGQEPPIGFRPHGVEASDEPFEIPAMGLGMFACRRDFWPKFCADETETMQGFGGEEHNIHEVVRQLGGKCVCLPEAKWIHRFRDDQERPGYPAPLTDKVRNYILWAMRIGKPIDPIYERFVKSPDPESVGNKMSQKDWDIINGDIFNPRAKSRRANVSKLSQPPESVSTIKDVFGWVRKQPRDLDRHVERLKAIGNRSKSVFEWTKRRESTIAFAASTCNLMTYTAEHDPLITRVQGMRTEPMTVDVIPHPYQETAVYKAFLNSFTPPRAETVFIDALHDGEQLLAELVKFAPSTEKWFVIRGTSLFGSKGELSESKGLYWAIDQFIAADKKWAVVYETRVQSGLTILSRNGERPLGSGGPGSELTKLLSRIGIHKKDGCGCEKFAAEMDKLGPDGCEAELDRLVSEIEANKEKWGWNIASSVKAAGAAVFTGLAFKINPLKPVESCIRLAIDNARKSTDTDKPPFFLIEMENAS